MKKLVSFLFCILTLSAFSVYKNFGDIEFNDRIMLRSSPEFLQRGAWTLKLDPIYRNVQFVTTNIDTYGEVLETTKLSYRNIGFNIIKDPLDTIDGLISSNDLEYSWSPLTTGIEASITNNTITFNQNGSIYLNAKDSTYCISNKIVNYTSNDTVIKDETWWIDNTNEWFRSIYREWKGYVSQRDTNDIRTVEGVWNACGAQFCANEYVYTNGLIVSGTICDKYADNVYIPKKCLAFRIYNTDGNSSVGTGNCIGNKVSVWSIHCQSFPSTTISADVSGNVQCLDTNNVKTIVHCSKYYGLAAWAQSKGIYTANEISSVGDLCIYVFDDPIPESCQGCIIRGTAKGDVDNDPPDSSNCVQLNNAPAFVLCQHGMYQPTYANHITSTSVNPSQNSSYRKTITPWHQAHYWDSSFPTFIICEGEPLLLCNFWSAGSGSSITMGWRIIRDLCREVGSTCNVYDITTHTKIVEH